MESDTVYCESGDLLEEFRTAEADYGPSVEPSPITNPPETTVTAVTTEEGSSSGTARISDDLEHSFEDREETETAKHFFSSSCCKLGPKKLPC